ncbi:MULTISPECIES: phage portal protein [Enterococcus]|uniref:Phage portal protein n=1 Tax=Enterococcus raffinosus TaxID=71452 RepID=A0AAW8TE83_9ENTE|nr:MULTISPECIES: phage portal protein [Enterococcus]MDT2415018.1 phage portal protein [Enterococcus avium]MDT2475608.1 phage portal protein [Enterococcus avium]MDT2531921.1 phage portal protein [Enterococcus raffinosus]MDT2546681.1 phage portal protein [Enterococcus raffinosus]MDT2580010.1 phage portal protein [Enterococcus raffinosus]
MKLKDRVSNAVYSFMEKRGALNDIYGRVSRYGMRYVSDDSIMESSDVYELVQDISNQVALAEPVVIGPDGKEVKNHHLLSILQKPNDYLTGFEFSKLETNTLLINGEVFPITDSDQLHLGYNIQTKLDERLVEQFKMNGQTIPGPMIRHIKNVGVDALKGAGIIDLAKNTLEGVLSAENVLTDKYTKGGLLAFLLKLDAHINPNNSAQTKIVSKILDQLEDVQDENSHSVKMIPLGKGYSIETLKSPVDDAAIMNYLGVYKKDLGKFLGINVETYQSLMKTDIEKAMMYLHNKAVKPILKNKSEHYSALFFMPNSGYKVEWKINILDFVPYSTKTNIGYNIVRTGITTPDNVAEMLGFPKQDIPATQTVYISNDLSDIGKKNATDNSLTTEDDLKGGDKNGEKGNSDV